MKYVDFRNNDFKASVEDKGKYLINAKTGQKEYEIIGFVNEFLLKVRSVIDAESIEKIPRAYVAGFNPKLFKKEYPERSI